jgi:hypothetical protein
MTFAEAKAHEDKISAQLHEAKALLDEIEAHARKKKAQAEIETITDLKTKKQAIDKKWEDLKSAGEAKVGSQIKTDIEADIAKFKASLDHFRAKRKSQSAAK